MITYTVKVYDNGTTHYSHEGLRHREDGPAVTEVSGYRAYYKKGNLHREDGPAVENLGGTCYYYLDGIPYTQEKHKEATTAPLEITVKELEERLGFKIKVVS
jgi:hypothetical protein|tara:strand:- start:1858 stop:2163 length:306 start_codon:yes stop_codon:yes gene_type:complete